MFEPGRFLRCKKVPVTLFHNEEKSKSFNTFINVTEFTYTRELIFRSLDETSQISFICPVLKGREHLMTEESRNSLFEAVKEVNSVISLDENKGKSQDIPFYFCTLMLCDKFHKDSGEIEDKYSRQQIIEWCHALGKLNEWICKDSEKEQDTPSIEEIEGNVFFQEMKEKYAMKGGEKV